MSTEIVKHSFDLVAPQEAIKAAVELKRFVTEKKLTANIKGKNYPLVEAWQFAGSQLGLYPRLTEVHNESNEMEIKYSAWVDIRRIDTDQIMSRGYAICSNKEFSKKGFDEYAVCSMAQTRAEGKAYRMLLSWLMKAAGFEATPAEEMDFQTDPAKKAEVDELYEVWQNTLNTQTSVEELTILWNGNKATCENNPKIREMFNARKIIILKKSKNVQQGTA